MMVLHSRHTNKGLKYLCPSVERIQSSADNKQASIVWCIPTLPTVAAPVGFKSSTQQEANRAQDLSPLCHPLSLTAATLKSRCVRWGGPHAGSKRHKDHIWVHATIIFMGENENGADNWQHSAFMQHFVLSVHADVHSVGATCSVRFNQSRTFTHHRWSLGGYFGVQYLAQGHCRGPEPMTFVSLELAA